MNQRTKWYSVLLALLMVVIVGTGCGKGGLIGQENTGDPSAGIPVKKAKVQLVSLGETTASGKLEALISANIVPKMPGKVAQVHVDIGSVVKAGEVLITLENQDLCDRVSQAEAGVAMAEAGVATAEAGLVTAQAAYKVAEANYERGKRLLDQGAIPAALFEGEYDLKYRQAKEQAGRVAPAQLELARAQLNQARANLQLARSAYNDSFIKAPFNGVVTARHVNPGEMASNVAPVLSLANLDKVVVKAAISEESINELKQGQQVQVKVAAVSEKPFTGVITNISPAMDPIAKAFPIKVEIDNPDHQLKPGIFAEVILNKNRGKALLVPREAVVKDFEKDMVWVVMDGIATRREVKVGASEGKKVIILEGVKEGEQVVTAGQAGLKDSAMVRIMN